MGLSAAGESAARQAVLASIPSAWRLSSDAITRLQAAPQSALQDCGLLSGSQLQIVQLTAAQIVDAVQARKYTATEIVEAFCTAAAIAHQILNCLVEFFPQDAIADARRLDAAFQQCGQVSGPLHGVPVPIKDIYAVRGRTVTMGFAAWQDKAPCEFDASGVQVMRDAGCIFYCRTTCPQTGMALETTSQLWGRTLNSINPIFGSGGSSGGDGALVGMRGAPASGLSSDIGGSIRAPAAFNGLYAMRPTSERIPKFGLLSPAPGNTSIKVSIGPICRDMRDLKVFAKQILTHPTLPHEITAGRGYWQELDSKKGTRFLRVGIMASDGAVRPHPPIERAIRETADILRAAGHEVVDFQQPLDAWQVAQTTFALYFQTGAKEGQALLAQANEEPIRAFKAHFENFTIKELTLPELFAHNNRQASYKLAFQRAWEQQRLDVLICPSAPMSAVPHDFPVWWGYTSLWNILDRPSIIMPLKRFIADPASDKKDEAYSPNRNPFDHANWNIYEAEKWKSHPVTLQLVGSPHFDEELISNSEIIDSILNR